MDDIDLSKARCSIPIAECMDGWLYWITARNAIFGVWQEKSKGFKIRRQKFGHVYPFVEYHWNTGAPYGTATPHLALERAPDELGDDEFVAYMESVADRFPAETMDSLQFALIRYSGGQVPTVGEFPEEDRELLVDIFESMTGERPGTKVRLSPGATGDERRRWALDHAIEAYFCSDNKRLPTATDLLADEEFCRGFEEATGHTLKGRS